MNKAAVNMNEWKLTPESLRLDVDRAERSASSAFWFAWVMVLITSLLITFRLTKTDRRLDAIEAQCVCGARR